MANNNPNQTSIFDLLKGIAEEEANAPQGNYPKDIYQDELAKKLEKPYQPDFSEWRDPSKLPVPYEPPAEPSYPKEIFQDELAKRNPNFVEWQDPNKLPVPYKGVEEVPTLQEFPKSPYKGPDQTNILDFLKNLEDERKASDEFVNKTSEFYKGKPSNTQANMFDLLQEPEQKIQREYPSEIFQDEFNEAAKREASRNYKPNWIIPNQELTQYQQPDVPVKGTEPTPVIEPEFIQQAEQPKVNKNAIVPLEGEFRDFSEDARKLAILQDVLEAIAGGTVRKAGSAITAAWPEKTSNREELRFEEQRLKEASKPQAQKDLEKSEKLATEFNIPTLKQFIDKGADAKKESADRASMLADKFNLPSAKELATPLIPETPELLKKPAEELDKINAGYIADRTGDYTDIGSSKSTDVGEYINSRQKKEAIKNASNDFLSKLLGTGSSQQPPANVSGVPQGSGEGGLPTTTQKDQYTPSEEKHNVLSPSGGIGGSSSESRSIKVSGPVKKDIIQQAVDSVAPQSADLADKEYAEAKEQTDRARLASNLLSAGTLFAEGLGGLASGHNVTLDRDFLKKVAEQAEMPISDLTTRRKLDKEHLALIEERQKNDPTSAVSQMMRDTIRYIAPNIKIPNSFTAAQGEKAFPTITQAILKKQHDEMLALQKAQLAEAKAERLSTKQDEYDNKRLDKISEKMTADIASGRTSFGIAARNLQTVQNAKALIEGSGSLDNLDSRQMVEMARILDRIVSQGSPTISATKELKPETARGYVAEFLETIWNEPVGAGQGKFAEKFQHMLEREEEQARRQIMATQKKLLGGVSDIAQQSDSSKTKQRLKSMLEAQELHGDFNQNGVFVPEVVTKQKSLAKSEIMMPDGQVGVKIKAPNGAIGYIPKSKLSQAKQRGAVEVE